MIIQIADVIDPASLTAIIDVLDDAAIWQNGKATAAGTAKAVKSNWQADRTRSVVQGAEAMLKNALITHETVQSAAQPAAILRILLSKYEAGMAYGAHVDAAYIDGDRADLSFTIFLNGPEAYEGGALEIETAGAHDSIKLAAGSMVVYPSSTVHQVTEVTAGHRLAAVGWIKSRVRNTDHRAILFDISRTLADLNTLGVSIDVRDRLANTRNNLLRMFGE